MGISIAGRKSICVPAPSEGDYQALVQQGHTFRTYLDPLIERNPELFPAAIAAGYWLHGSVVSKKLNLTTRRIKLVATGAVDQVRPDFALPYMAGKTDDVVERAVLAPIWCAVRALAYVFGCDASYWYRLYQSLGRFSSPSWGPLLKMPKSYQSNWLLMRSTVGYWESASTFP